MTKSEVAMLYLLGLGGNQGNPKLTFERALELLSEIGVIEGRSRWYETEPLLHPDWPVFNQRPYLNGVVALRTSLSPDALLASLLEIEQVLGRNRRQETVRWGPRIIDLDILACEDKVIQRSGLCIPHQELHKRSFVLEPMRELAPKWVHPILGKTVEEMAGYLAARNSRS